jgi:hypothetical protein
LSRNAAGFERQSNLLQQGSGVCKRRSMRRA